MELSKQVCSLPLSQRLQKLGVPQESLCCWLNTGMEWLLVTRMAAVIEDPDIDQHEVVSAYTVAELGMLLPDSTHLGVRTEKVISNWYCELIDYDELPRKRIYLQSAENEAEARGLMLAYLLENGLITSSSLVV